MNPEVQKQIAETVKGHPIVLFVKGSPQAPMCGFSKAIMDIFSSLGAEFKTVDVLSDPDIREGVKEFTQWPTKDGSSSNACPAAVRVTTRRVRASSSTLSSASSSLMARLNAG